MKNKWSPGKTAATVLGAIGGVFLLLISLFASMDPLARNLQLFASALEGASGETEDDERYRVDAFDDQKHSGEEYSDDEGSGSKDSAQDDDWSYDEWSKEGENWWDDDDWWQDEEDPPANGSQPEDDGQYYEFHDAISPDLSYQVKLEQFADFAPESTNVMAGGEYPKVTCEDKDKEKRINKALYQEIEEVYDYIARSVQEIEEDQFFLFEVDSYVTYMDEDVLSIAYVEYGYLDDDMFESYVVSVNIDMESGLAMTNSQILHIDDDFSIDFRERTIEQNGDNDSLNYYTDQEITEMLNDDDYLIIFYTPLGMEVGFNYYFGWVTVTYTDYKDYMNPL